MISVLNAVREMIANNISLYSSITIGSMPADNGLSIYQSEGKAEDTYLNKATYNSMDIVFNGKHQDQLIVAQALDNIHSYVTRQKQYPSGVDDNGVIWQITNIITSSSPSYIGQEPNEQYLYRSVLKIKFYYGGN